MRSEYIMGTHHHWIKMWRVEKAWLTSYRNIHGNLIAPITAMKRLRYILRLISFILPLPSAAICSAFKRQEYFNLQPFIFNYSTILYRFGPHTELERNGQWPCCALSSVFFLSPWIIDNRCDRSCPTESFKKIMDYVLAHGESLLKIRSCVINTGGEHTSGRTRTRLGNHLPTRHFFFGDIQTNSNIIDTKMAENSYAVAWAVNIGNRNFWEKDRPTFPYTWNRFQTTM